MRCFVIACLIVLTACGRPLTETETAFARTIHGDALDTDRVRLVHGAPTRAVTFRRVPRPRTTCRERLLPPPTEAVVTSKPAAVAFYNRIFFDRDWYLDDYLPDYPDRLGLVAAMLLAHELTHVWQWQNRRETGYTPLRAAFEHDGARDPYLFDLENKTSFGDFGFEQQGAIVEEFVCCRTLDPGAPRTARLHALIAGAMPVAPLQQSRVTAVGLPWDGVEIEGICS
ncbi:hypothetical protein [uncultured Roseobacter sp.]|uniref:hypothetical protein n=1 Tax=uncultured Roseobacter sp. TaxID=114847 RepID=UPI00262DAD9A|nr:hypothetical protein [uncultured Roseobacter sp.]